MKYLFSVLVLCLALSSFAFGQGDEKAVKVTPLNMPANSNVGEITGNIKDGQKINLRWAESSSVACFPGTRFEMFNGNNVFYRVTLPAASSMKITLTPSDGKIINLYALRQGAKDQAVPPNVTSAISCEASYPIYANVSKDEKSYKQRRRHTLGRIYFGQQSVQHFNRSCRSGRFDGRRF